MIHLLHNPFFWLALAVILACTLAFRRWDRMAAACPWLNWPITQLLLFIVATVPIVLSPVLWVWWEVMLHGK